MTKPPAIRVRVVAARGSTPREVGAEMIVTADAIGGSIGGGPLEFAAIARAREMLAAGAAEAAMQVALGPATGQCCGGQVTLALDRGEPASAEPGPLVLIYGAGHVGRALAAALLPLPFRVRLIDPRPAELALAAPGVETVATPLPEAEVRAAPAGSAHVVMTHDHALDFLIVAEALRRADAAYVGMIGSATKRAVFDGMARQQALDPSPLVCPIGAGFAADKRPAVIAAFAAAEIAARLLTRPSPPKDTL